MLGIGGGEGKGVAGHAFKGFTKPVRGFPVQRMLLKITCCYCCLFNDRKKEIFRN